MHPVEDVLANEFGGQVAEHALDRRTLIEDAAAGVEQRDDVRRALDQRPVVALALLALLRELLRGGVFGRRGGWRRGRRFLSGFVGLGRHVERSRGSTFSYGFPPGATGVSSRL